MTFTFALLVTQGCARSAGASPTPAADAGAPQHAAAALALHDERDRAHELFPAIRCGECHGDFEAEWRGSAHARADDSEAYAAMRARAGSGAAECEACHAPLSAVNGRQQAPKEESVTCQVCHAISEVAEAPHRVQPRLALDDVTMFGPRCDLRDHHFHKMGCSPLHEQSQLCASCHHLVVDRGGVSLTVYPEYSDWQRSDAHEQGLACQDCHMPTVEREIATGAGLRKHVPTHRFLTEKQRLGAVSLRLRTDGGCGPLTVSVEVTNRGAGHALPAGNPARELSLWVGVRDEGGALIAERRRIWSRRFVDARGDVAPWFEATRIAQDDRLAPDVKQTEQFSFEAPCRGTVEAAIEDRSMGEAIAARLGVSAPAWERRASRRAEFSASRRSMPSRGGAR